MPQELPEKSAGQRLPNSSGSSTAQRSQDDGCLAEIPFVSEKPDPAALNHAGIAALRRYRTKGQVEDLNQAVKYWQEALGVTSLDSPELPDRLNNLGAGLRTRYIRTGMLADLEEAITAWEQAVQTTPSDSPDRPGRLSNLGAGLSDRYRRTGALADLEVALQAFDEAIQTTPSDSPDLPGRLNNLGNGLRDRYMHTSMLADLEAAIAAYEQAVKTAPADLPNRPMYLNSLSVGLSDRYRHTGVLADLETALTASLEAVQATPPDSPSRPMYLNSLGNGLSNRYKRTGALTDLEAAIVAWEEAVQTTPYGSPERPVYLNGLSNGLSDRYAHTGALADLEASLEASVQAVQAVSDDSPDRPRYLNNLGTGLSDRYKRTREMADLEAAIRAWEQAIQSLQPDSLERPACLNNLGNGLRDHYRRTGEVADLEAALQAYAEAIQSAPVDSPDRPRYLNNLGNGLDERYLRTGELHYLEASLQAYVQAIQATPLDSPDLAESLNSLGEGLRERYARTGKAANLETALHAYEEAIGAAPIDSPDRPRYLNNLGSGLSDRYKLSGALTDLEAAIRTWEQSWSIQQFQLAALPVVYQLGQQRRRAWVAASLVTAYLERERSRFLRSATVPPRALEVAEGSKSRLLTHLVGRGPLPLPVGISSDLAIQEQQLLAELTSLDAQDLAAYGHSSLSSEAASHLSPLQQRQTALRALEGLWASVERLRPGGAAYVALRRGAAPTWQELARLAKTLKPTTALLSLFITLDRTFLFLMRAPWRKPRIIETSLSRTDWNCLLQGFFSEVYLYQPDSRSNEAAAPKGWGDASERFFGSVHNAPPSLNQHETWEDLLLPLMKQAQRHLPNVERLIIAPAGNGHLLPWAVLIEHVGWRAPDETPLPLIMLPALGVLPHLRQRPSAPAGPALVVGNPLGDLPQAEAEALAVARHFKTAPLLGRAASKEAVLSTLARASLIHLATHAFFHSTSPLESGIVLTDGVLTAREILQQRLQADLLVLSACESGQVGSLGGEELAGLSQAFLQAGVRSLLVSLWRVNDPATAALMQAFYAAQAQGFDKAASLRQAMTAIQQKPHWRHPHYWGAFVLLGDWK